METIVERLKMTATEIRAAAAVCREHNPYGGGSAYTAEEREQILAAAEALESDD